MTLCLLSLSYSKAYCLLSLMGKQRYIHGSFAYKEFTVLQVKNMSSIPCHFILFFFCIDYGFITYIIINFYPQIKNPSILTLKYKLSIRKWSKGVILLRGQWRCFLHIYLWCFLYIKSSKIERTVSCLVAHLCLTLYDPMDCSRPSSSVLAFSRHKYWSKLLFPSPRG